MGLTKETGKGTERQARTTKERESAKKNNGDMGNEKPSPHLKGASERDKGKQKKTCLLPSALELAQCHRSV